MKVKDINDKFEINQLVAEVLDEIPINFEKWFRNSQVKKSIGETSLVNYAFQELEKQLFDSLKIFDGYKDFSNDDMIEIIKNVINKINTGHPNIVAETRNVKTIIELQISDIIRQEIDIKKNYLKKIADTKNKETAQFKSLLSDVKKMIADYERPKKQTLFSRISQAFRSRSAIKAQKRNEKRSITSLKITIAQLTKSPDADENFQRQGYADLIPKSSNKKETLLAALEKTLIKTKDNELSTNLSHPIVNILKKFTTGSMAKILKRRKDYEQFKKEVRQEQIDTQRLLKDTIASQKHLKLLDKENKTVKPPPGYERSLKKKQDYLKKVNTEWKKTYKNHKRKTKTKKISFANIEKTKEDNKKEDEKAITGISVIKTGYDRKNRYWRDPFSHEERQKILKQGKENENETKKLGK